MQKISLLPMVIRVERLKAEFKCVLLKSLNIQIMGSIFESATCYCCVCESNTGLHVGFYQFKMIFSSWKWVEADGVSGGIIIQSSCILKLFSKFCFWTLLETGSLAKRTFFLIWLDLLVYYLGMAFQSYLLVLKPCFQTVGCDNSLDWEVLKKKGYKGRKDNYNGRLRLVL